MGNRLTIKFIIVVSSLTILLMTVLVLVIISTANKSLSKQADTFIDVLKEERANEEGLLRKALLVKGESLTRLLVQTASGLIASYDFVPLAELSKSATNDPDISFVVFYDKENNPLTEQANTSDEVETLRREIFFDDELVGLVVVGLDYSSVKANKLKISERIETSISKTNTSKTAAIRRFIYLISVFSALGVITLCFVIFTLISSFVIKPVTKVVELSNAIAKGDLSVRLNMKRRDEIGDMADALDNSCKDLSDLITQIKGNADVLATSSEEMSAVSAQMSSSSEEMKAQSETVAGATEEMSTNINAMASAAEEMSVNIQGVSTTSEQMSQNMNSIAASIEEMSTAINDVADGAKEGSDIAGSAMEMSTSASDTMNTLGKAAKEIGNVTALIKRIAEQTNLLALNATIEAASAGDAGKGFAVVANEIKELANQSAQAAEDIAKRIEGVQTNTEDAVKFIGDISNIVGKINEASVVIANSVEQQRNTSIEISVNVQQANTGANNIASAIAEVAKGANDMAKGAAEAAKGVNEVSTSIQGVSEAAGTSNIGAQQVRSSAEELAKLSGTIQEMVGRFKIKTD